jgi:hypothetical protein
MAFKNGGHRMRINQIVEKAITACGRIHVVDGESVSRSSTLLNRFHERAQDPDAVYARDRMLWIL